MILTNARFLAPTAALAVLTFAAAQPAFATPEVTYETCPDFAIGVTASNGKVHVKEFFDETGEIVVRSITVATGVVLTYSNAETGKSVSYKTSGSVSRIVNNPDGSQTVTATGHNGILLFKDFDVDGPSTTQYTGKVVYTVSPIGVFDVVSHSGRAINVCAALSS